MPVGEQYRPAPFEQQNESAESITEVSQNTQKELGAKILTQVGFENRQKNIVNSSFDKARETKEKLLGKNNERRNYAYISRIENLVEKYGNKLEKKLWDASANKMIIQSNDIPESYWRTQEQILRDNGQGRELNSTEKEYLIEDIQKQQRESLRSWSDYLGDKNSPYPTWFKIYAWDGMSKMGVFDADKKRYTKRDKTSVAPYPKLNPAALAKVHGAISDFYGIGDGAQRYAENEERDAELDALVKSGNFNKLYSKMMLDTKTIVKTPERTEDIKGEWVEYLPGQEEVLAEAAEGTPWCVADPGTGRNYLEYGNYSGIDDDYDDGHDDDYDDDYDDYDYDDYDDDYDYDDYDGGHDDDYDDDYDYDDNYDNHENHAKFILFHLNNPETNNLANNACASIRLDPDGNVAEISGLKEGQALEDPLVPIVEEKVKSLPGGEKFLEAFADKQELIKLDRKMQNGEDLTKEELEFIWEVNRPIKTLDTYNGNDPRIRELRSKFDIETCLEKGLDVNDLVPKMDSIDLEINFDALLSRGADIDNLVSNVSSCFINDNFDMLLFRGADINNIVSCMYHGDIAKKLDTLINHGADINNIVSHMYGEDIAKNLDALINHGADINNIVSHMYYFDIAKNLDTLLTHGADVNIIVSHMHRSDIDKNLDTLKKYGYEP